MKDQKQDKVIHVDFSRPQSRSGPKFNWRAPWIIRLIAVIVILIVSMLIL